MKRTIAERLGIYWPFPRLRYRLRHGRWCDHAHDVMSAGAMVNVPAWEPGDSGRPDGWRMIDMGRRQIRRCSACEYAEFRP